MHVDRLDLPMPDFDFDTMQTALVEWPKRGRKPKPIPDALVKALQESVMTDRTPYLVMDETEENSFSNLLNKAGTLYNMRIERHIERDTPMPGKITFHFRARGKRNKEIEE